MLPIPSMPCRWIVNPNDVRLVVFGDEVICSLPSAQYARLIAAVPDMLAACQSVLSRLEPNDPPEPKAILRDGIAAAEGGRQYAIADPWIVAPGCPWRILDRDEVICDLPSAKHANLIAAAPALLLACQLALQCLAAIGTPYKLRVPLRQAVALAGAKELIGEWNFSDIVIG